MKIVGMEGLSDEEIGRELEHGAKFVIYTYVVSIIVLSFKNGTDIHFVKSGESRAGKGAKYTLLSILLGWWGIPWGLIYTIGAIVTNSAGGKDVTDEVLAAMNQSGPARASRVSRQAELRKRAG